MANDVIAAGGDDSPDAMQGNSPLRRSVPLLISISLLVLSVTSLVMLTTIVQVRSQGSQREISRVIAPAAEAVKDVEVALALQMAAYHAYARLPNADNLRAYDDAVAREHRAYFELQTRMQFLDHGLQDQFARFSKLLREWHAVMPAGTAAGSSLAEDAPRQIQAQRNLDRWTLAALRTLEDGIAQATVDRRRSIDASERLDWYFTIILCLAALIAGMFLIWFYHRMRALAQTAEQRRLELERLIEARAGLMRGLSHDIKNPLGAVAGYTHLLKSGMQGELTASQQAILTRIERSVRTSMALLEDVLELSQAHAGKLAIHPQDTNLLALLEEVADDYRPNAESAGLTFETKLPSDLPSVFTDDGRVRRVVGNLLSNAVKYTPVSGTITLTAGLHTRDDGSEPGVIVVVQDSGPGIPAAEQERIFDEFYRIPGSERHAKGLGVGLAISRTMARLLSGDLTVTSTEGEGATFLFWLPLGKPANAHPESNLGWSDDRNEVAAGVPGQAPPSAACRPAVPE